jgi:hypothetical protein
MSSLTKLIVIIVAGAGLSLVSSLYLIRPALNEVSKMNSELTEKKIEAKTLEQQILAFKTAQSDLAKATEKERITRSIVSRYDLVEPIKVIEKAVSATGSRHTLSITDYENMPKAVKTKLPLEVVEGKTGIEEVPYTLGLKNDFVGIVNVLRYLEHSPYFTEISKIQMIAELSSGSGTGVNQPKVHTGQIEASIDGVLFITKDEKGI